MSEMETLVSNLVSRVAEAAFAGEAEIDAAIEAAAEAEIALRKAINARQAEIRRLRSLLPDKDRGLSWYQRILKASAE